MRLDQITLKNFRRFDQLTVDFHPELTMIVARNGQGKTTVLDAATALLGPFAGAFDLGKSKHIDVKDARYQRKSERSDSEQQFPVTLTARIAPLKETISRELNGVKSKTTIKGAAPLSHYGKTLMEQVRSLDDVSLPMLAYYGSGRLWNSHKNMQRKSVLSESRTMGYEDCFSSASSFTQVQQWMSKATYAALQQQNMDAYNEYPLQDQIDGIQQTVDRVLENQDWSGFHYSMQHEELAMTHPEFGVLPVSMLSDGVRAMVSLVADMAWRCAKLNPHLGQKAQTETDGIAFIDEVDMHLHPEWQQTVMGSLQNAFPKMQFIATTHSPQVLSTVPAQCIRVIDGGHVHTAPSGTKGAESSRILKCILGVETRPPADENTQLLKAYEKLVYADQWNSPEAREQRTRLDDIFSGEEPKLTELDLYIENREWELDLEKDQ
ncbi:MAG: ATP-binding protein [Proteobacteria bacterium]|nr:MAG: ATP-binding protein [Pseudomonadota bacterium]